IFVIMPRDDGLSQEAGLFADVEIAREVFRLGCGKKNCDRKWTQGTAHGGCRRILEPPSSIHHGYFKRGSRLDEICEMRHWRAFCAPRTRSDPQLTQILPARNGVGQGNLRSHTAGQNVCLERRPVVTAAALQKRHHRRKIAAAFPHQRKNSLWHGRVEMHARAASPKAFCPWTSSGAHTTPMTGASRDLQYRVDWESSCLFGPHEVTGHSAFALPSNNAHP